MQTSVVRCYNEIIKGELVYWVREKEVRKRIGGCIGMQKEGNITGDVPWLNGEMEGRLKRLRALSEVCSLLMSITTRLISVGSGWVVRSELPVGT